MNAKKRDIQNKSRLKAFSTQLDFFTRLHVDPDAASDPEAVKSLEKTAELMISAYLVANLKYKNTPLKEFMDNFEKKVLLACLRLTHGSQKNAANIIGLKSTTMFEKMRKHNINGKRIKLSEKLQTWHPYEKK